MPRVAPTVSLDPTTKTALDQLVRSPSAPQGLVQRGRIVLAAAAGKTNQQIASELQMPEVTVSKWRRGFVREGLEGLQDAPRSGRPVQHGAEIIQRVQRRACQQPKHYSRWSVRTLAQDLKLPRTTVHQILVASHLQPHRLRTFTFSPDPDFETKLLDIVGLYLNPPENALVLCVDEKTGIQALDRTQPLLPLSAQKPRSWTNEYVRHGTQTLLAALEIASGQVVAHVKQRRTSVNFLRFLKDVVAAFPEQDLHMVLDNLNIHKNQAAQRWLELHPRVRFHYTPTHASWVNMVECFFSILGKQALSQSVHTSKRQLKEFLLDYIARNNENPRPFVWTKGPEKLQRIIEATQEYQAANPRKPRRRRRAHNTIKN
ncbi:MAG TPA: IS630 family transposase [Candidatus Sulfotelmatobacter sp.]|nr:IS630 family transposase [Candidatus Sulfotelmatobacter sp.]